MTDHVTPSSHPDLTEDQRGEVNEGVSKWKFSMRPGWPIPSLSHKVSPSELANAVERIVAEVTA